MVKSFSLIIPVVCFCLTAVCQQDREISFATFHKNGDTNYIRRLLNHGKSFEGTYPDSAVYYYKKATALALSLKNSRLLLACMQQHMEMLNYEAKFEDALSLALQHITMANH